MPKCDPVIAAVKRGHAAIMVTGNYRDHTIVGDRVYNRPAYLESQLDEEFVVMHYSRSRGFCARSLSCLDPKKLKIVQTQLRNAGLHQLLERRQEGSPEETMQVFRGFARLLMVPGGDCIRYAAVIDYTENLAPNVNSAAAAANEQTFVAESLHNMASSPALKKSGNALICIVQAGKQNSLLNDLYRVDYDFPSQDAALIYIQTVLDKTNDDGAPEFPRLEEGLSPEELARITRGLPLKNIERMFTEARDSDNVLTRQCAMEIKAKGILATSEGTLSLMTTPLELDDLVGMEQVKKVIRRTADKLNAGSKSVPLNDLFVGPPGTGKSTVAPIIGKMAGFNVVKFELIKDPYVGESERKTDLALRRIEDMIPALVFIDEITEMIPNRSGRSSDSGVSQNILGRLFQFFAREELRGKVILVAASNVAERLDPAWLDRFVCIPLLELASEEMHQLVAVMAKRINTAYDIDPQDPIIVEACDILHKKGVSPRKFQEILIHAVQISDDDDLTPEGILEAAREYTGTSNPSAVAYTSLTAISLTSFRSYLPWADDPKNYKYPWYLKGIVDPETGDIDRDALHDAIKKYQPEARL